MSKCLQDITFGHYFINKPIDKQMSQNLPILQPMLKKLTKKTTGDLLHTHLSSKMCIYVIMSL